MVVAVEEWFLFVIIVTSVDARAFKIAKRHEMISFSSKASVDIVPKNMDRAWHSVPIELPRCLSSHWRCLEIEHMSSYETQSDIIPELP